MKKNNDKTNDNNEKDAWTLHFLDNKINAWRSVELNNVEVIKHDRKGNETWVRIYADKEEVFKNDNEITQDNTFLKKNGQRLRLIMTGFENRSFLRLDFEKLF